jgi:hypothetical protein
MELSHVHGRRRYMVVELERFGGVMVRWSGGLMLLVDASGAWLAFGDRVLGRLGVGEA